MINTPLYQTWSAWQPLSFNFVPIWISQISDPFLGLGTCWGSSLSEAYPGPVFCLLLGVSSDFAQPITGQVTEVTCPVIGQAQPELTPSKRQKTGPACIHGQFIFHTLYVADSNYCMKYGLAPTCHWRLLSSSPPGQNNRYFQMHFLEWKVFILI